jgi:hypothetical protein
MSVSPRYYRKDHSPKVAPPAVVATDLLKKGHTPTSGEVNPSHPLAGAFTAYLGEKTPTRRQAANFLQKYPDLRVAKAA